MENEKKGNSGTIFLVIIAIIVVIAFIAPKLDEGKSAKVVAEISELPSNYYYNQLNTGYKKYGQQVYSKLYEEKESLKRGHYDIILGEIFSDELEKNYDEGEKYLETSIMSAIMAFNNEHPEVFYFDTNKLHCKIIKSDKYRVNLACEEGKNYYIDGVSSKEDVQKMEQEIKDSTSKIMNELKGLSSDYEKIKRVHDYLIETIEYKDSTNAHNIYGALVEKKCVCEGYALAFQYFMNELGIESMLVSGEVKGADGLYWILGDKHAWNYVKVDGNWYAVDTTWDDVENKEYKYFLKGKTTMDVDHTPTKKIDDFLRKTSIKDFNSKVSKEEEFTYPVLSITDYEK